MLKETTGAFDGAQTYDLHITCQTCNTLRHAALKNDDDRNPVTLFPGSLFNASHLSRALCCRVEYPSDKLPLPAGYHINHPDIEVTSCQDTSRALKAGPLSINWSFGDEVPEITDGASGQTSQT